MFLMANHTMLSTTAWDAGRERADRSGIR